MLKKCIVETPYGFKLSQNRVINSGVVVELTERDIIALFKRNKVKVYEVSGDQKIMLTLNNYNLVNFTEETEEETIIEIPVVVEETVVEETIIETPTAIDEIEVPVEETIIETPTAIDEIEAPVEVKSNNYNQKQRKK